MASPVLRSIRLRNYKGFRDHTVNLKVGPNILLGANNAGKSTVLSALRLIVAMLPTARRVKPSKAGPFNGGVLRGWPVTNAALEASAFSGDNVRYDFRPDETSIEVAVTSGVRLIVAWAENYDDEVVQPIYFVKPPPGSLLTSVNAARDMTPNVAILPTFSPLEDREQWVSDDTIRRNLTSRRSSRYMRNSLLRLDANRWADFKSFVLAHTPEISDIEVSHASDTVENDIDLFFTEPETGHLREMVWAGDGMQIWVQILYHYWRQADCDVLLLDEPDIYLHPDLQRRLARIVFPDRRQVVLATHSIEILAEADPGSAVWIDRSRRSAERPRDSGAISRLGQRLGSGYELGVARALRSSLVLFVEGGDAPLLAQMAKSLGFEQLSQAQSYATVPLGGFSRRDLAATFGETITALGAAIKVAIVLDSDLRSEKAIASDTRALRSSGALVHVWMRREIENYLLDIGCIARASKMPDTEAGPLLESLIDENLAEAKTTFLAARLDEPAIGVANKTLLETCDAEFDVRSATFEGKLGLIDPKAIIKGINSYVQQKDYKSINSLSLARNIRAEEAPSELLRFFRSFQDLMDREM